ncbi:uncharacterized protein LOC143465426 isoform X3 [Clavelina lepadiformis]|uniref:uncharacterized protein LOC143465426 isoform X3 n=1 Tax=Clavelina lepadiformis TaxID=159417 RepID=UPI00404313AA
MKTFFWNDLMHYWMNCFSKKKRNLETNTNEARTENAATRGVKMFLHRVEFYGTLLTRFIEYVLHPLKTKFSTSGNENPEFEAVKEKMQQLKTKCESLLSDASVIILDNVNHSDAEKRFPVISVIPRVHELLSKMVMTSFQWRLHARYEQQFEEIAQKRALAESEGDLNDKRSLLRNFDHGIRKTQRSHESLEEEIAERQQALSTSNFAQVYEQCIDQIERVQGALEQCKSTIQSNDSTIKAVQETFGKYKIIGPKRKHKLESSIVKRTKKVEELAKIQAELERLEEHKAKLDEEEVSWMRGGYENAVNVINTLKEQSQTLVDNLKELEQQKDDLKSSYEQSVEEVLKLSMDYEQVNHKYEYEKRLAAVVAKTIWNNNADIYTTVRPNKITTIRMETEGAYPMLQPKGVALVIHNDWATKSEKANKLVHDKVDKNFAKSLNVLLVQCGYYVIQRKDLTTGEIQHHMIGLSDQYHGYQGDHSSLLAVIVAQSNERGQILDDIGKALSAKDLLDHFSQSRCPALIGKPKVFLLFLRVSVRDPVLPRVNQLKVVETRKKQSSASLDAPTYFEPEALNTESDFLVVRVMYEDDFDQDGKPTFGGGKTTQSEDIPWFVSSFVTKMSEQAGDKDFLTILKNIKRHYMERVSLSVTSTLSESKASVASRATTTFKLSDSNGHVNMFIDSSLKKPLYLMPGL